MSDDVSVVEASETMLLRLCREDPRFEEIIKVGFEYGLDFANLVWGSKTPGGCSMLFCLNYEPKRNDNLQPSIATLMHIARIILEGPLGYTKEAAVQFLESECSIADRSPFKFDYAFIHANKVNRDRYKEIQAKTDPIMKELFEQVIPMLPNVKAAVVLGSDGFDFFTGIDCLSPYLVQTVPCPHSQIVYNNHATSEQRDTFIGILTDGLSMATGVIPSRSLTFNELNDAIFVSQVPTSVRIAKGVETRALNAIFKRNAIGGMKREILGLAPLDDEVRERIDTMSHRELGLWIHHFTAAEKKATVERKRLEAAEKKATVERKRLEAVEKKTKAITRAKSSALWTRLLNGVRRHSSIADVISEFNPKRKRKV